MESSFSVQEAKKINVNDLLKYILNNKAEKDSINSTPKTTHPTFKADKTNQNEATKNPDIKLNTPLKALNTTQKPIGTQKPVPTLELTPAPMKNPATIYQNANYTGWVVGLDVGNYNMFQLLDKGLINDDASSIKVASGYKVTLYEDYNFTGRSVVLTADCNLAAYGFDNIVSSIKVESDTTDSTPTKIIKSQFMRFESYNFRGQFIRHQSFKALISQNVSPFNDSVFNIVTGLADPDCISFESKNFPGYYLMHENFKVVLKKFDGSVNFKECATFRKVSGLANKNLSSFQSINYPNRYIRHKMFYLQIDEIITDLDKKDATYNEIKVE
jgi:hypothetical protein